MAAQKEVGSIVFAQEYLAEFVDAGQGMLKPEWLHYFSMVPDSAGNIKCLVEGSEYYLANLDKFGIVDLATTTNKDSDFTVITSFARTPDNRLLVIDMTRAKLEGPDIIPAIKRAMDKNKLKYVGIERQGFQTAIIQMAQRAGIRVKNLKTDKDKVTRALPLSARMESGDVFLLRDTHWLPEVEREIMTFPAGAHDDIIDTLSYGVQMLQEATRLERVLIMAENKSRFSKALDWLNAPTDARVRRELNEKGLLVNQSEYSYLNQAVMGYNTQSGYFDHKKLAELGDGTGNSAVIACLSVLATSFAEPGLLVATRNSEGDYTPDMNHPMARLFRKPNPYMTQQLLANYIVTSLNANGDAFIYKNRNQRGQVVELVPLMPHSSRG